MSKEVSKYTRGKHPNSRNHGFKPGQSGNPKGRPKGVRYISEALRDLLSDKAVVEEIARKLMERAKESDNALDILLDRTEGKVTQSIEGQIRTDVVFTIGKGYAEGKLDIQPDKQATG